ncbi:hypothetical protein ACLMJK_001987 [Lecanora helva]
MSLSWEHAGELPSIPPPLGVKSNFRTSISLQPYNNITQTICIVVTTLLVSMRIWTKASVLKCLGWDDYTSILAWVGLLANSALFLEEDRFGNGKHLWDVKGNDFTEYAKLINVSQIIYGPVIFIVRLSIILQFLRVFAPRRTIRTLLYILLVSNGLFYIAGVFVEIFRCKPRMKIWYPLLPGTCVDQNAVQICSGVFNTASDFAILVIPVCAVWSLELRPKTKIRLIAVFGTGLLGCIACLIRMVVIIQKSRRPIIDATWEWYSLNLWTTAEISCGIICGCLAPLPAFLRYIRGKPPLSHVTSSSNFSRNTIVPIQEDPKTQVNSTWTELRPV